MTTETDAERTLPKNRIANANAVSMLMRAMITKAGPAQLEFSTLDPRLETAAEAMSELVAEAFKISTHIQTSGRAIGIR